MLRGLSVCSLSLRLKKEKKHFRSRCDVLMAQLVKAEDFTTSQLKALGSLLGTWAGCWRCFTLSCAESELQICCALSGAVAGWAVATKQGRHRADWSARIRCSSYMCCSFLSFCLSAFLSVCLSVFLSFCLSVFLSFCLFMPWRQLASLVMFLSLGFARCSLDECEVTPRSKRSAPVWTYSQKAEHGIIAAWQLTLWGFNPCGSYMSGESKVWDCGFV